MTYLIFIIFFLAACFLIYHSTLLRRSGLPVTYWILFFTLKTGAGCYYGYWYGRPARVADSDTWRFHYEALEEYRNLFRNPAGYFSSLRNNYADLGGLLSTNSYWNDLKDNLMIKIVSIMHVMSGGHYYVNVVIYSYLTLFAFLFFYLACRNVLHQAPGLLTTAIIFLTPSCLFWTSGLHRDGFMLLFTGLFFWQCTCLQKTKSIKRRNIVLMVVSFAGLFFFRSYVAILLIPPVIAWAISYKFDLRPAWVFVITMLVCLGLIFLIPTPNLPVKLIERKAAFELLAARSGLPHLELLPNITSFVKNLPRAIERSVMRPYAWQTANAMEIMAAIESFSALVFSVMMIFWRKKGLHQDASRLQWMTLWFCVSVFLLIGYTIPIMGAIVRYRAMFLMLSLMVISFNFPHYTYKKH